MKYIVDYELYNTLRDSKHSDGTPKYEVSVDEADVLQLNIKCIAAGQKEKIKEAIRANSPVWKKEEADKKALEKRREYYRDFRQKNFVVIKEPNGSHSLFPITMEDQIKKQRDLIQRLVKESKSNRV